ncbi:MAG: DEAD/DEAH box helicase [Croceimicrobium sp.]
MTSFSELGLSPEILRALEEMGFETPSPIQAQAIPALIEDARDLIGLAQTGTGKTAAFGIPLLERIDPDFPQTQALILAPTRELGQQIGEQLSLFSKYLDKLNVLTVYGGANIQTQMKALKKPQHIVIATPGRLIDLIKRRAVNLKFLEILVLDEADEMLNMGFKEDLDEILSYTPKEKMTWLFSATMPREIRRIVDTYMYEPFEVKIDQKQALNPNIEHQVVHVRHHQKGQALRRFIDLDPEIRAVVFCRTKLDTQGLAEELMKAGYAADALHGDLSQVQRDRVMRRFKSHELPILVATDVAARGIDVNDLTHVFHFALPDDAAYYTHRSGRTARAGKKGISMAMIGPRDTGKLRGLERDLKINFEKVEIPEVKDIANLRLQAWGQQILDQAIKNKIPEGIYEDLALIWENLSKEELMARIIAFEATKLNLQDTESLNVHHKGGGGGGDRGRGGRGGGGRGYGGGGGRGGYGGGGGGRGGDRNRGGGGPSFKGKRKPFKSDGQGPGGGKRKRK